MFFDIRMQFISIDVLINNAASLTPFSSALIPSAKVREMIDANFYGLFLVSREAIKLMSGSGFGRIVNISSMAELLQPVGDAIYTATKSAATSIAQSFSKEFAASGITCNTLAITYLPTPMSNKLNQIHISKAIQSLPLKTSIDLEDITNVINFYIDKKSSSITGQYLALGGLHR